MSKHQLAMVYSDAHLDDRVDPSEGRLEDGTRFEDGVSELTLGEGQEPAANERVR